MADLIEIARIQKSKAVSIIFSICEYEGELYIDVREHVSGNKFAGFTKKGYRFNTKHLSDFQEKLSEIAELIKKEDFLEKIHSMQKAQMFQNEKDKEKLNDITKYLSGLLGREVTSEEIYKWMEFCYQNGKYKEALKLFDMISDEEHDDLYGKMKKIAEICKIRLE